jgi:hypothetical protein
MTDYLRDNIDRQFADLRDAMRDLIARVDQLEDKGDVLFRTEGRVDALEALEALRNNAGGAIPVIGPGPRVCKACLGTNANCPYCHTDYPKVYLEDVLDFIENQREGWADLGDCDDEVEALDQLIEALEDKYVEGRRR